MKLTNSHRSELSSNSVSLEAAALSSSTRTFDLPVSSLHRFGWDGFFLSTPRERSIAPERLPSFRGRICHVPMLPPMTLQMIGNLACRRTIAWLTKNSDLLFIAQESTEHCLPIQDLGGIGPVGIQSALLDDKSPDDRLTTFAVQQWVSTSVEQLRGDREIEVVKDSAVSVEYRLMDTCTRYNTGPRPTTLSLANLGWISFSTNASWSRKAGPGI